MKIESIGGRTVISADESMLLRRIGSDVCVKDVSLASGDIADNWEEVSDVNIKYSRWGIIKALEKRGIADQFDAYLDATPAAFRRFYGPQFFRADDADFKEMLATLAAAFKMTDADIAAILAESPYTED